MNEEDRIKKISKYIIILIIGIVCGIAIAKIEYMFDRTNVNVYDRIEECKEAGGENYLLYWDKDWQNESCEINKDLFELTNK